MTAKVSLKVIDGKLSGKEYPFTERSTCIIGRSEEANVCLPNDKDHDTISRYHCLLDINPPNIRVRDFGSRNGTYVNGEKIGQREEGQSAEESAKIAFPELDLKNGDQIRLGKTAFRVVVEEPLPVETIPFEVERRSKSRPAGVPPSKNPWDLVELLLGLAKKGRSELVTIKDYSLLKELGKGGMGAVYLARHQQTGEEVALKVMLPKVASNKQVQDNFLRETKNTQALRHPNIVELRDSGCSNNTFFFTLEYCDGGSVNQLIEKKGGKLSIDEAAKITLQCLDGLSYAHQAEIPYVQLGDGTTGRGRGLVHRDMKPANIYLSGSTSNPVAKLGDFGLSKAFDGAGLSGQTATGSAAGTPSFMPRTQVLNFKYSKPEVDVWATAASFYKMLTGCVPRNFSSEQDPCLVILKNKAVPIRERNPAIPKRLAEVIDSALIDNPRIVIKSALALKQAIAEVL